MIKLSFLSLLILFTSLGWGQTIYKTLEDSLFEVGDHLKFPQISFSFGKTAILPESIDSVEAISEFMKKNPSLHIEIGNHTDYRGNQNYNLELCKRRAKIVFNMLTEQFEIPAERLTYKGYGESQLVRSEAEIESSEPDIKDKLLQACRRTEGLITKV